MHVYACVHRCTWVYIFSYPNIAVSKRKCQFPKRVAEKAEQEAAAGQWGSLTYSALYKSNIYTAGLFINGDWKTQRSLQVGDKCGKFTSILCFGCGTTLTQKKSEELMLNYLDCLICPD